MTPPVIPCPFVYANRRRCTGVVRRARAYGPLDRNGYVRREKVRKYRLWCSEKDDHAGILSSPDAKARMEFYPDELGPGIEDQLWNSDLLS
jgi:hypothetical protein